MTSAPQLIVINEALIEKMENKLFKPVFSTSTKPSPSKLGKKLDIVGWKIDDNIVKNVMFRTGITTVKYGPMKREKRIEGKDLTKFKDVPTITYGTKSSELFGRFAELLDEVVFLEVAEDLQEVFKTKQIDIQFNRISKNTYGGNTHKVDPEKKQAYLDAKDWKIELKLKYNPKTMPEGSGKCYSSFMLGKKEVYPTGLDIDTYISGGMKTIIEFEIRHAWVKEESFNRKTQLTPWTLYPDIMIKGMRIKPREKRQTFLTTLSPEEEAEFDDEEEKDEDAKKEGGVDDVPDFNDEQ